MIRHRISSSKPVDSWRYPGSAKCARFVLAVQALKKERAECMWKALERIIPDVRKRTEVELVATPLTHEFFNRRFKGEG